MPIYKLKNKIMDYPWGTIDYIPDLLKIEPTGEPQAEMWMGVHPKAPSEIEIDGKLVDLHKFLSENRMNLDFLFKVLSAKEALSIQVHPNKIQAKEGYSIEKKAGLGKNKRTYTDMNAKPELFYTLSNFWTLIGFRKSEEIIKNIETYCKNTLSDETAKFKSDNNIKKLLSSILNSKKDITSEAVAKALVMKNEISEWILSLHRMYPGDKGIVAPLYMALIKFPPGSCVFVPAGVLHSYLQGSILELMGNSDNVVRGGLTNKYVNIKELLNILSLDAHKAIKGAKIDSGQRYEAMGLVLDRIALDGELKRKASSCEIVLCTEGCTECDGTIIEQGESVFVTQGTEYCLNGNAEVFVAMHN